MNTVLWPTFIPTSTRSKSKRAWNTLPRRIKGQTNYFRPQCAAFSCPSSSAFGQILCSLPIPLSSTPITMFSFKSVLALLTVAASASAAALLKDVVVITPITAPDAGDVWPVGPSRRSPGTPRPFPPEARTRPGSSCWATLRMAQATSTSISVRNLCLT